ncbi:MAG TPA: 4-hydroxy-3-methylbut-2-enyl diphosphate reductase [Bacteroidales bacterium]|nr:4-hydroxy-3-methylbut-2-enyl diphosphate reductase [Bacteroidales bacterium]
MATIEIDSNSGFCTGVVKAIKKAETFLNDNETLLSLGDIVHNNREVERLESKGMRTITNADLEQLRDVDVLFRAHGEPPITYEMAEKNNIRLIDATCPVVITLQAKIRRAYENYPDAQIVIFGKNGHAEVVGLLGQTNNTAIVLEKVSDAAQLDFSRNIVLFSQTTKALDDYKKLAALIKSSMVNGATFMFHDTICRQVANRLPHIKDFARNHDCVLFVSGSKSSNGKALFDASKGVNARTYFITGPEDVALEMIVGVNNIGICGATSTPVWLMEDVKKQATNMLKAL